MIGGRLARRNDEVKGKQRLCTFQKSLHRDVQNVNGGQNGRNDCREERHRRTAAKEGGKEFHLATSVRRSFLKLLSSC